MKNRLRETWAAGKPALNGWLGIPSTFSAEIMSKQDFDSITIDLQHGLNDYAGAVQMMQAMSASDATMMCRVPWLEAGIIMKLLDAGALGIICPMINSREEAERFVGATLYDPDGYRSSGPVRAGVIYPDYHNQANKQVLSLAMIETQRAVERADEICSTPGLTGIYVGPSDLAITYGEDPGLDRKPGVVCDAIQHVLKCAKDAGIKAGLHCMAPSYIKQMYETGFNFASLSNDVRLLTQIVSGQVAEVRS
ncbi:MAG: 2,4-dihydroxyhept-2-ene-1,7-dioic acid aldolase [Rhodospirillaceae bacterium]|nr:2,4-dihydroxyhept-2-ene-1,7-dioic acid aldolase [Rhodospirillaceae bacterium]